MPKSFSKGEKFFFLHNFIFIIPLSVVGIFISFFIWEKTNSLVLIAVFYLLSSFGILLGCFLSSYFLNHTPSNIIRGLGSIFTALPMMVLLLLGDEGVKYVEIIGFIFGFAIGLRAMAYKVMFIDVITTGNRETFVNLDNAVGSIADMVIPLGAAFLVGITGNFSTLFALTIVFFTVSAIPAFFIKDSKFIKSDYGIKKAWNEVKADADLRKLMFIKFFDGIKLGVYASIWSVIVLSIVGSLESWGIFNTGFAILSTIITYTIGRKIKFGNSKIFFVVAGTLLTMAALFYASNLNIVSYILFSFTAGICESLFDIGYQSIESKILDREVKDSSVVDEIALLEEVPLFLGRIVPLALIILVRPSFDNDLMIRILIIAVGAIPFIISSVLVTSNVTKRSYDPFVTS